MRSSVRLPFVVTTSEMHDLTCTRYTSILALWTLTLLMTPTTRLTNASISMGLSRRIQRMRQPLEEGMPHHLRSSPMLHGMKLSSLWTKECNSSKSMNYRTGSTRNEKICAYFSKPLSTSTGTRTRRRSSRKSL
jgi:hypothetical protein